MSEYGNSDSEEGAKLSDVSTCLNYLKKREVFLFKMMNDPSHKAMLYFLEVLMNSEGPLTLAELTSRFNSKAFTNDMRDACGNSEEGLRRFLLRYPSLFRVNGSEISAMHIELPCLSDTSATSTAGSIAAPPSASNIASSNYRNGFNNNNHQNSSEQSKSYCNNSSSINNNIRPTVGKYQHPNSGASTLSAASGEDLTSVRGIDFGMETEAVKYFQNRMSKREERWVLIKSLAGHLSQASAQIRQVVGPQSEFKKFLLKHPHVFEVQGELVGLKDTFSVTCLSNNRRPAHHRSANNNHSLAASTTVAATTGRSPRPKSLVMPASAVAAVTAVTTPMPVSSRRLPPDGPTSAPSTPAASTPSRLQNGHSSHSAGHSSCGSNPLPISMTAHEYKSVMFLRRLLEKRAGSATFSSLMKHVSQAPETVRNTIGWMRVELEEFVRKRSAFFDVQGDLVTSRKGAKINILISTGGTSKPGTGNDCSSRALINRCGRVFYVAKLWGIIDLGQHEHVFFDRSIFKHLDDLQKHFKIDEVLYFNAILAPKESRAKWRATQVWKESDREIVEQLGGTALSSGCSRSSTSSNTTANNAADLLDLRLTDEVRFLSEEIEDELDRVLQLKCSGDMGEQYVGELEEDDELDSLYSLGGSNTDLDTSPDISMHSEPLQCQHQNLLNSRHNSLLLKSSGQSTQKSPLTRSASARQHSFSHQCAAQSSLNHHRLSYHSPERTEFDAVVPALGVGSQLTSKTVQIQKPETSSCDTEAVSPSSKSSIATQTLSTGDIMATQIFHESMSKLV